MAPWWRRRRGNAAAGLVWALTAAVSWGLAAGHAAQQHQQQQQQQQRHRHRLRLRDSAELRGGAGAKLDPEFFAEDAEKMRSLPTYAPRELTWLDQPAAKQAVAAQHTADLRELATGGSLGDLCAPRCGWGCETQECQQVCEPTCAPPECKITCGRDPNLCETRCGAPQCAVICPPTDCPTGGLGCGKCKTVCSPPVCTTECGDKCQTFCAQPKCTWNCHRGACPKPSCQLFCSGFRACEQAFHPVDPTVPPPYKGELVGVTEGVASMDPSALLTPVTPPPHWVQVVPEPSPAPAPVPAPRRLGPVAALKLRWRGEDAQRAAEEADPDGAGPVSDDGR